MKIYEVDESLIQSINSNVPVYLQVQGARLPDFFIQDWINFLTDSGDLSLVAQLQDILDNDTPLPSNEIPEMLFFIDNSNRLVVETDINNLDSSVQYYSISLTPYTIEVVADDLTVLNGVNDEVQVKLNEIGVFTYTDFMDIMTREIWLDMGGNVNAFKKALTKAEKLQST